MKNLFLLLFSLCALLKLTAQVPTTMPPDANEFYNNMMPQLRPQLKNIVLQTAKAMKNRRPNADSLEKKLLANNELKGMSSNDIEGISVLIMVQASKDADADLKNMVMAISHNSQKENGATSTNSSAANANKKDNYVADKEVQDLKLQMIINRKSNMAEEISYVMKKISGSQEDIMNNLK